MGLGKWEPRLPGCEEEHLEDKELRRIVKRAYSFSCSVLDGGGRLRRPSEFPYFEFYVVLVRHGEEHPPGLTPRLFALRPGDRLFVGPKATGHYTLDSVRPDDNVVLVATGTGEAPHNVMVAQLLSTGHRGQIVTVTCVRQRRDLGYLEIHRQLERTHANYRYLTLTTREPENLDASHHEFVGKRYLQDYFESGRVRVRQRRAARSSADACLSVREPRNDWHASARCSRRPILSDADGHDRSPCTARILPG